MTNREWLQSLSDEDFVKWLLDKEVIEYFGKDGFPHYKEPSPKLHHLAVYSTDSRYSLLKWLREERQDKRKIDGLNLDIKIKNALKLYAKIEYIYQLQEYKSLDELSRFRGIGSSSINKIKKALKEYEDNVEKKNIESNN